MKEKWIKVSIIIITILLFMGTLLPYNYPSDIYNIIILGFKGYANTWFMTSGRTICSIVFYLFDYFNISLKSGIVILKILSIVISSSTIYIFYNLIIHVTNIKNKKLEYFILFPIILIFINYSSYEYFYYTESAIMWLGLLMVVLALKVFLNNGKNKYLKIFFCLFLAINCYQATILFYIPGLFLQLLLQKKDYKVITKELFYNSLIVLINLVLGYIIVITARYFIDFEPFQSVVLHISIINYLRRFIYLIILFYGSFPNLVVLIVLLIVTMYLVLEIKEKRIRIIVNLLLIWLIGLAEVLTLVELTSFYAADRIIFSYVSSMGMVLVYALSISNRKLIFVSISVLLLISQIINSNSISIDSRKTREEDKVYGKIISEMVKEYEEKNNIKLKKIEYCFDNSPTRGYKGLRKTTEPTCRGFCGSWIMDNIFNYYCKNHNFTKKYNQGIYRTKFKSKEWDEFSKEQIIFENDTIYFCIY